MDSMSRDSSENLQSDCATWPFGNNPMSRFLLYRTITGWSRARLEACLHREMVRQGKEPAFIIQKFFVEPMTIQWLMAACTVAGY